MPLKQNKQFNFILYYLHSAIVVTDYTYIYLLRVKWKVTRVYEYRVHVQEAHLEEGIISGC
jgi:hypothetical protein